MDKIAKTETLDAALELAKPHMDEVFGHDSPGALMLSVWAMGHVAWADVGVAKDETSFALVQKDPDEARGKRLCATGSIVQIQLAKTEYGKMYEGLLHTYGGNLVRFLAAGSSGELVESSEARMCGVVTGKYDYSNSGGGTGHAIEVVGMFDLPANRKPRTIPTADAHH